MTISKLKAHNLAVDYSNWTKSDPMVENDDLIAMRASMLYKSQKAVNVELASYDNLAYFANKSVLWKVTE